MPKRKKPAKKKGQALSFTWTMLPPYNELVGDVVALQQRVAYLEGKVEALYLHLEAKDGKTIK